jgi:hypothetical protein
MADFLSELASGSGLEDHEAHHGIGGVLSLLKGRLNPEAYAHLQNAIPNSERMLSAFQEKAAAGGGLMDTVKGMAAKILGGQGQDSADQQNQFAIPGLSAEKLGNLLPQLHDMLAGKIPTQVLDQIKQHVPGFGPAVEHAGQE